MPNTGLLRGKIEGCARSQWGGSPRPNNADATEVAECGQRQFQEKSAKPGIKTVRWKGLSGARKKKKSECPLDLPMRNDKNGHISLRSIGMQVQEGRAASI